MKRLVVIIGILSLVSCSEKKQNKETIESSIVANEENEKALKETLIETEKAEQEMMKSLTTMTFDKVDHDFGSIKEDKEQTKTITVEANTDPQITILSIHASVLPK